MTDELEKEANDYANKWLCFVKDLEIEHKTDPKPEYIRIKEAYIDSAEPREKRIADLEKQIEKMKCFLDEYLSWYKNNNYSINDLAKEAEEILDALKE